jgi:hypothetical protein
MPYPQKYFDQVDFSVQHQGCIRTALGFIDSEDLVGTLPFFFDFFFILKAISIIGARLNSVRFLLPFIRSNTEVKSRPRGRLPVR